MRRSVAILLLIGAVYGQNEPLPEKPEKVPKPGPRHPPPPPPPPSYVTKIVIPPPPFPPHAPPPKDLSKSAESQELPSGPKSKVNPSSKTNVDADSKWELSAAEQEQYHPKVKRAAEDFQVRVRRADSVPQQSGKLQLPSGGVPVGMNSGSSPASGSSSSGLPQQNGQVSGSSPASGPQNGHPVSSPTHESQSGQAPGSPPSGPLPPSPSSNVPNSDNKPKIRARRSDNQEQGNGNNLSDQFGDKVLNKDKQSPGQIYKQLGQLEGNLPKTKRDVSDSNDQGALASFQQDNQQLTGQLEHVPAEFPGGDRPFVQNTQNGPVPGVVGQNSANPGPIPGGQQILNDIPSVGMPNDGESVEDPDSKDLSASRPRRNSETLLEGKPIKHESETKDSDGDQEQEFPHDSFNPRSRRHVGFYEHGEQKDNENTADQNGDDASSQAENNDENADSQSNDSAEDEQVTPKIQHDEAVAIGSDDGNNADAGNDSEAGDNNNSQPDQPVSAENDGSVSNENTDIGNEDQ